MIDEFQDTDPVQYRIFDRIYNLEGNNSDTGLILIGDPKQAIYAFRGADIYTYLQAKDATQGRHFTLKKNFRSTTGMVQATNALFEHGEKHALAAFRFRSDSDTHVTKNPLPFVSVDAQGKDDAFFANGQTCKPMTLWHLAPDEGSERVSATRYRNEMAQTSASEIVRLLNLGQQGLAGFGTVDVQQSVKPGDIAILVRNKLEADAVQSTLAERSVNSVYLSDRDSVFATQEAQDLLIWLKACAEPSRDTLLRNALATSTLDLPIGQLDELNHDELAWEEQVDLFSQYRRIWWQQGVLAMCHRLLHDFELPGRLLAQTGGERRLTNVLHLAEWLQQSAAVIEGDFALIRYLAEHIGETSDEFILRLESDDDLVKVITIHKSKGLEYPLVFLPFISSWKEASGDRFSYHSKSHKGRVLEISGKKAEPESWLRADSERLSEDLRLIYVALTRAKYATWLGIAPLVSGNSKKPQLEKGALGYLLAGGATFTPDSLVQCLTDLTEKSPYIDLQSLPEANLIQYQEQTSLHLTQAEISQVEPKDPWWIASYSALQTGAVVSVEDASPIKTSFEESDFSSISSETSGFEATDMEVIDLEAPDTPMQATAEEESDQPDDIRLSPVALQNEQHLRELHLFPRGANAGTFLHGLLEWAAEEGFDQAINKNDERLDMLQRRCQLRGWQQWVQPLSDWLTDFLSTPWQLEV
jgi:exodeoxyribonuclease V beta subunit